MNIDLIGIKMDWISGPFLSNLKLLVGMCLGFQWLPKANVSLLQFEGLFCISSKVRHLKNNWIDEDFKFLT